MYRFVWGWRGVIFPEQMAEAAGPRNPGFFTLIASTLIAFTLIASTLITFTLIAFTLVGQNRRLRESWFWI